MTDASVIAEQRAAIGPGRLILVVGPSGAGKDTLLGFAKAACADDHDIVFPRRLITRQASASEDNEEIGADAFQRAAAAGLRVDAENAAAGIDHVVLIVVNVCAGRAKDLPHQARIPERQAAEPGCRVGKRLAGEGHRRRAGVES